jgi:hypothetical protein
MAEWTRNTPWRQGHLLTNEAIRATGLSHPKYPDYTLVIVASHDCDLAQLPDREPQVEVLVGRKIFALDGNNTHAKSTRTIHIEFQGDKALLGEFVVTEKTSIPKKALVDFSPATGVWLAPPDRATFQLWLASRYRRSAFPDEFERRLKESGLSDKITKALKPSSKVITTIFFDVDEGQELTRTGPDDVYMLDIYLLYSTEPDYQAAEASANEAKATIDRAFRTKLFDTASGTWTSIELRYIEVISEEAMTYRESQLLKQWRLDHISMGANPQQSVLGE